MTGNFVMLKIIHVILREKTCLNLLSGKVKTYTDKTKNPKIFFKL